MSVVVVVKVSDGLVLGADSAATLSGRRETRQGVQEGVLKTYFNARKLMQIGDFPIGLLTWGQAFVGPRTIESIVREWEYDNKWQSKKDYLNEYAATEQNEFNVKTCAEGLCHHLSGFFEEEYGDIPELQNRPVIGVVVAGYSQRGFFPEIWRFILPVDIGGQVHDQRPDKDGKPEFGASWFGLTDAIVRLHFGRDEKAIGVISEAFGISADAIHQALLPLQYQVPFAVMPLQDAIEYSSYLLNVAIGRFRFVIGPELCGGRVDIAAITQRRFDWISRKTWTLGEGG